MVIVAYGLERLGCHGERERERGVCGGGDGEELRGHKGEGRRDVEKCGVVSLGGRVEGWML